MNTPSMTSSADATRFAALTIEPKVLERIVALLPMDSACHAIGDATALLQTIAAICRSLPKDFDYLARHIGPENHAFWRAMVLRCFDFTINRKIYFNVKDYNGVARDYHDPDASDYQRAAVVRWQVAHPDEYSPTRMLSDDLAYWVHLDVYFQPQQYGFLRKIQYGELGLDAWPDHEDPFTLFCDLAFIKDKFPAFKGDMQTKSDGDQILDPVFLSSYRNEVTRRDQAFLQHCGYAPHYWTVRRRPISNTWKEFASQNAKKEEDNKALAHGEEGQEDNKKDAAEEQEDDVEDDEDSDDDDGEEEEDEEEEDEDEFVFDVGPFPDTSRRTLRDFQALVRRYMDDLRAVAVNREGHSGPTFYVGRMKRSGRWLGFVGQRDY
ncbi:hypothetical protein PINS_up018986 [Pythium insidiosum]|nr:hypothetical protein PINS_up018986 [Pythium insidiosum]